MRLPNYLAFRQRSALLTILVGLVAGCAALPALKGPCSPVVPASYSSPVQHSTTLRAAGILCNQGPCCPRFVLFHDPILQTLVARAEHQNLSLCESYQRIVEARAWTRVARGGLFPTADASAEYARTKRSSNARPFVGTNGIPFDLFSLGFDTSWEIDLFGKLRREVEVTESELAVQQENYQDVRLTLLADVASNYIRVRVLQNQLQIAQQNHAAQKKSLELVGQLHKAGKATALDVAQARSLSYSTLSQVPELEQQMQLALNQLSILLGEAPGPGIRALIGYGPIPLPPKLTGIGIPADLLRRRPDIRRSEQEVVAASGRIGVARAELYPQLSLLGTISVDSRKVSSLFTNGSLAFSAGPAFRWNILNFWRVTSSIEAYKAQFSQAVSRYRNTVLVALREVEDGLTKYDWQQLRVTLLEQTLQADEQAVELSLSRYKSGKASYQRVLDSQKQLLLDKQELATSRGILALELIRISKAVGGGWCEPALATGQPAAPQEKSSEGKKAKLFALPKNSEASATEAREDETKQKLKSSDKTNSPSERPREKGAALFAAPPSLEPNATKEKLAKPTKGPESKAAPHAESDSKPASPMPKIKAAPTQAESNTLPVPADTSSKLPVQNNNKSKESNTKDSGSIWRLPSDGDDSQAVREYQATESYPVLAVGASARNISNLPYAIHLARGWPLLRKLVVGFLLMLFVGLSYLLHDILVRRQKAT